MEITKGEEVTTVTLREGDDLGAVPRSHRKLLTPELRTWWNDPRGAMGRVAEAGLGPNTEQWFRTMAERGEWVLNLHKTTYDLNSAGFQVSASEVRGAEVGPPSGEPLAESLPAELAAFYRLVGYLRWADFGTAGGLEAVNSHTSLRTYAYLFEGMEFDPAGAFLFGWGGSGDMLFYTADGRAGRFSHETGEVALMGSVVEAREWVFDELLAGRRPFSA